MSESKRFDDYTCTVDCNECERFWTNQCDGVTKDTQKVCNSFLATRSVVIPAQIKALDNRLDRLRASHLCLYIVVVLHLLIETFGG